MRAIDADALMEAINTWPKFGVDERCRIVPWDEGYEPYIHLRDAVIAITGMPTIEERKKGKWIGYNTEQDGWKRTDGSPVFMSCSECNGLVLNNGSAHWNFCPNCGADMRGDGDD